MMHLLPTHRFKKDINWSQSNSTEHLMLSARSLQEASTQSYRILVEGQNSYCCKFAVKFKIYEKKMQRLSYWYFNSANWVQRCSDAFVLRLLFNWQKSLEAFQNVIHSVSDHSGMSVCFGECLHICLSKLFQILTRHTSTEVERLYQEVISQKEGEGRNLRDSLQNFKEASGSGHTKATKD